MTTNNSGLVTASRDELLDMWLFDDDIFQLFAFSEWLMWCKIVGVAVNG